MRIRNSEGCGGSYERLAFVSTKILEKARYTGAVHTTINVLPYGQLYFPKTDVTTCILALGSEPAYRMPVFTTP